MNVLLIGSGGREHALAYKIIQSPKINQLFIAPGNGGTDSFGKNINLDVGDHSKVIEFCGDNEIELVVIGPEAPLVAGLADELEKAKIAVFGPSKQAAQLEGSKKFTKELCDKMQISTAAYKSFAQLKPALDYIKGIEAPIVVKADGLAAGKGVTVAMSNEQAKNAIIDCFDGQFGDAGAQVVIEEFLSGPEVSFFAICDGENFISLSTAQDHKRAFDGDKGPNTGGMGAFSPSPLMTDELVAQVEKEIITPTLLGMKNLGAPFKGVLYAGLILTDQGPKLIEYNVRFGDPECQVLMMRLQSDLLPILLASANGDLTGIDLQWTGKAALSVVMASKGYPGAYKTGSTIMGADELDDPSIQIFHAGTIQENNALLANGGRVLNVTALGTTIAQAREKAYAAVEKIDWTEGFCRTDIGLSADK